MINPFDILSGKVAQTEHGTFYFKEAGNNTYKNGCPKKDKLHRDNGLPAAVYTDGDIEWWVDGKRHREDGPAVILQRTGLVFFYLYGFGMAKKDYERRNKPI